jgi:excisionase family DNA binding protein
MHHPEQQKLVDQTVATPLLTVDDVALLLGTSKAWVRDHATRRNPRIPVVRLGGRRALLRFRREDVNQFIKEHLISTEERGV